MIIVVDFIRKIQRIEKQLKVANMIKNSLKKFTLQEIKGCCEQGD